MSDTNRINAGLRKIDALRKKDNPPIGELEFIKLVHHSYMIEPKLMMAITSVIIVKKEGSKNENH